MTTLAPRAGARLDALLVDAVTRLGDLPDEAGHLVHGDYKGDNLLVDGDRLVLLDFDRVSAGDPALDVGKLVADLRWWAQTAGHAPELSWTPSWTGTGRARARGSPGRCTTA